MARESPLPLRKELVQPEFEGERFTRFVEEVGSQLRVEPLLEQLSIERTLLDEKLHVRPISRAVS